MDWLWPWLKLLHIIGIATAVGAATVRALLLQRVPRDPTAAAAYVTARKPLLLLVVVGVHLLLLSGVGWLLLGYPITTLLVFKIVAVFAIAGIGAFTARRIEPDFIEHTASNSGTASTGLIHEARKLFAFEALTASLYYVIIAVWVLQ